MSVRKIELRAPVIIVPQDMFDSGERSISFRAEQALIVIPRGADAGAIESAIDRIPWAALATAQGGGA